MWWGSFHIELGAQAKRPSSLAVTLPFWWYGLFQDNWTVGGWELILKGCHSIFPQRLADNNINLSTFLFKQKKFAVAPYRAQTHESPDELWGLSIGTLPIMPSHTLWKLLVSVTFFSMLSGGICFVIVFRTGFGPAVGHCKQSKDNKELASIMSLEHIWNNTAQC